MTTYSPKPMAQHLWDFIGIPFRLALMPQKYLPKFKWTTLEDERFRRVLPELTGKVLDVGAGPNTLINLYGNDQGTGVDVFDWGGGALVVEDSANLPFEDESFDCVCFVACLNHIPYREAALKEAYRLLKPGGRVIITMIDPILGEIGHKIWWHSEDKHRGGMIEGEVGGMWTSTIVKLCRDAGLKLVKHKKFVYLMNNLYVFEK